MLPPKNRLPREEFRARGYRAAVITPYFSIRVRHNPLAVGRLGVVVGTSVDKRATRRNFLERQVKGEFLRTSLIGKDLIVTIFPKVKQLTKQQFVKELKQGIKKI